MTREKDLGQTVFSNKKVQLSQIQVLKFGAEFAFGIFKCTHYVTFAAMMSNFNKFKPNF